MELDFKKFLEQGTKPSVLGVGAGGRLGQSQATPEKPVTAAPSPFNTSSFLLKTPPKIIKPSVAPAASSFNASTVLTKNQLQAIKPAASSFNVSDKFKVSFPVASSLSPR